MDKVSSFLYFTYEVLTFTLCMEEEEEEEEDKEEEEEEEEVKKENE